MSHRSSAGVGQPALPSDQPMDPGLGREQPVGVFPCDYERYTFEAGLFAGLVVNDLCFKAALFGPSQVHAQEHLGPILRLRPTCAWMDRADGVQLVVLSGKQHLCFCRAYLMLQTFDE